MINSSFGQSLQADLVGLEDEEGCALAGLVDPCCASDTDSESSEDSEDSHSSLEDDSDFESNAFDDVDEAWSCADADVTINPTCDCSIRDSYTHGSHATCGSSVASEYGNIYGLCTYVPVKKHSSLIYRFYCTWTRGTSRPLCFL